MASISRGPFSRTAARNCSANSAADVQRVAGTPIPAARLNQSRSGAPMSMSWAAAGPKPCAPVRCISMSRMAISPVGEDHGQDIQLFASHCPEGLQGVHPAAIGFECKHLAVGTRNRSADCDGKGLTYRTSGDRHPFVRRRVCEMAQDGTGGRNHFFRDQRIFRQIRGDDAADGVERQRHLSPAASALGRPPGSPGGSLRQELRARRFRLRRVRPAPRHGTNPAPGSQAYSGIRRMKPVSSPPPESRF